MVSSTQISRAITKITRACRDVRTTFKVFQMMNTTLAAQSGGTGVEHEDLEQVYFTLIKLKSDIENMIVLLNEQGRICTQPSYDIYIQAQRYASVLSSNANRVARLRNYAHISDDNPPPYGNNSSNSDDDDSL